MKLSLSRIDTKAFVDVPASKPDVALALPVVGITARSRFIRVRDPFGRTPLTLLATMRIFCDLPARQRGLHLSRIEGCLHEIEREPRTRTPVEYAEDLCRRVRATQGQKTARVEMDLLYGKLTQKNASQRSSEELLSLHVRSQMQGRRMETTVGMTAPFINACPCPQRWSVRAFTKGMQRLGLTPGLMEQLIAIAPRESHTNRGTVTLLVASSQVSFHVLYGILDDSTTLIRELLSGEDEHLVVRESVLRAQFCEDVVRETARHTVRMIGSKAPPRTLIGITVDVDESIHVHNLHAEIHDSLGRLRSLVIER